MRFLMLLVVLSGCVTLDTKFRDPWHAKVAEAGIVEKQVQISGATLHYAEGPANGPALLLLHAQHMDWFSYSRVLPELSKSFHVFAVSYEGHGGSTGPADEMDATHIGGVLALFIEGVIREPALVTGNSSGGLLATWLAANKPQWVKAVLLEDPPLFTAEFPRSQKTVAFRTFTTCHTYLQEGRSDDFLLYWLSSNKKFVTKRAGELGYNFLVDSIKQYRAANPGQRLELNYLEDIMRLFVRGLDVYDPHFGDAFFDGRWNRDFDHADALRQITAHTMLMHANFSYQEDGTLDGAMDQADADRAMSLLQNGAYERIDAQHTVHIDKPDEFIRILKGFFLGS